MATGTPEKLVESPTATGQVSALGQKDKLLRMSYRQEPRPGRANWSKLLHSPPERDRATGHRRESAL